MAKKASKPATKKPAAASKERRAKPAPMKGVKYPYEFFEIEVTADLRCFGRISVQAKDAKEALQKVKAEFEESLDGEIEWHSFEFHKGAQGKAGGYLYIRENPDQTLDL